MVWLAFAPPCKHAPHQSTLLPDDLGLAQTNAYLLWGDEPCKFDSILRRFGGKLLGHPVPFVRRGLPVHKFGQIFRGDRIFPIGMKKVMKNSWQKLRLV